MKTKLLNSRVTRFSNNLSAVVMGSRKGISATFKRDYLNLKWDYDRDCGEANMMTQYIPFLLHLSSYIVCLSSAN